MIQNNKNEMNIDVVSPHTIKKIELIEAYVKDWSHILLNYKECDGIVFIDCMCNCGSYKDSSGEEIIGTPVRVAQYLASIMPNYPKKKAWLFFNDLSQDKINYLKTLLPQNTSNLMIHTTCGDGNELLKRLSIEKAKRINYLLIYDPYTASIDWYALLPFLQNWGEVIINHMVHDSIRGISQAKRDITKTKYERTYLSSIDDLAVFRNNRDAYEKRIQEIISSLQNRPQGKYFIASFPFFNSKNALVYNLIHCSGSIKGFRLFKKTAWKVFGGKSSIKDTHGTENQLVMDIDGTGEHRTRVDEYCYYIKDIAEYLHNMFLGQKYVPLKKVWQALDQHPVFPSEGFRNEIKSELKKLYEDEISKQEISFSKRR
jgi:three-Cys-motif partner protein